jgi:hypothetical protein
MECSRKTQSRRTLTYFRFRSAFGDFQAEAGLRCHLTLATSRRHRSPPGRGNESGAITESSIAWIVEFKSGKVIRVREYLDPKKALEAVGLRE